MSDISPGNDSVSGVPESPQGEIGRADDPQTLDAFICYSRKDGEFCRRLETALEKFKPPPGLPRAGHHLDVFRDEDDFVGPEYFSAIEGFLSRSRKLIVVCSPAARDSEYTNDEIRRFVTLHGPGDLVVVLVDGVPNNEAGPDEEHLQAFPEALCEAAEMPLAIDWRDFDPSSDRVDRGRFGGSWYTLLAGLLDVDRSVIEQRDRTRARRRRRIIGSLTGAVMLVLASLSVWALTERAAARVAEGEEQKQRLEAEAQRDTAEEQRTLAVAAERAAADSARVAQEQRAEAEAQRNEAEAQRARAFARLLAGQAADLAARDPALLPRAMLLAVESLRVGPNEVAAGVIRAGLGTLSRLRLSAPPPGVLHDWEAFESCGNVPGGTRVEWRRTDRAARVVRPDGRLEILVHDGPITLCAFLDDGSIATYSGGIEMGAGEPLAGDGTVRVWDPPPRLFTLSPEAWPDSKLTATAFSPTDPLVAVASLEGGAEVLDLESGRRVARLAAGEGPTISHLTFSGDGRYLASAQTYGETFDVWAVDGFEKVASFEGAWGEGSVTLSPTGDLLVGRRGELAGDGRGLVWDVAEQRALAFPPGGDTLLWRPELTPDGRRLTTVDNGGKLTLWDVRTRLPIDTVPDVGHIPVFGHGSAWLYADDQSFSFDRRWPMAPGDAPARLPESYSSCLAFGPGTTAARCMGGTLGESGGLEMFDSSSGRTVRRLEESVGIETVGISPDGRWVAGDTYEYGGLAQTGLRAGNTLKVWDARTGSIAAEFGQQGLVAELAFSRDGSVLGSSVYLSEESGFAPAAIWVWRPEDLAEQACRAVSRNLTLEEWGTYMVGEGSYRATCDGLPPNGMNAGWGTVVGLDLPADRVIMGDVGWSPVGYCDEEVVADRTTRVLIADPAGGWRSGTVDDLSMDDDIRIYVRRLGTDDCPADGAPVSVVTRGTSSDSEAWRTNPSLVAAAEALDSMEARGSGQGTYTGDPEVWHRIDRAGMCEWEASRDGSGMGIRTLYCSLERSGFIDWFVADAPMEIFLEGPHDGPDLDLESEEFGRYNPDFVTWAADRLLDGLDGPIVNPVARVAYRPWAHLGVTYAWALTYLDEHPDLDRALQGAVAAGETDLEAPLGELRDAAYDAGLHGEWAEEIAVTAAGFWVRRGVDGSREAFREALNDVLAVLDPAALAGR